MSRSHPEWLARECFLVYFLEGRSVSIILRHIMPSNWPSDSRSPIDLIGRFLRQVDQHLPATVPTMRRA